MRVLKRDPDERAKATDADAAGSADTEPAVAETSRRGWRRRTVTVPMTVPERAVRRTAVVPSRSFAHRSRWANPSLGAMVAIAAGAALAILGGVVLMRAGVDDTWTQPRVQVFDANHTALLGALEIGVGVALMIAGATGSRLLVAILGLALAIAAAAVAIEPAELQSELAIERWWAWVLAATGAALVLSALSPPFARRRAVVDVPS
jgi:hypothetical protein